MNILGKNVVLRALEEDDLPLYHEWGNDPEIWLMLSGWHFPTSLAETRRWWEATRGDPLNQRFAIQAPDLGFIGTANLIDIDWKNNHAFHGMMLGKKEMRGKGYGTDTIMAIMRYAFEELHLERLDGSMIEYNAASFKVYCDRCNWQIEGRQRNWYFRQNRYWDRVIVGITRGDYEDLISRTDFWTKD